MKFKFLFFLLLWASHISGQARMKPSTVGNAPDESVIYNSKRTPKSFADKGHDALSFLKLGDKNNHKKSTSDTEIGMNEVFTLETVNGDPITNVDVMNATKLIFFFSGKAYDKDTAKMIIPAVIESLEDDKLREQCAKLFGMQVTDKDVEKEVLRLASMNNISVPELEKRIASSGIRIKTFRQHIRAKLIFQLIAQYLADNDRVTTNEIETAKKEQQALIASKRYLISEIFRYELASAEKIRQLALKGFDFQTLAENFSQTIKAGKRGTPKWCKTSSLEPEVSVKLSKMKAGTISEVIKTKSGYKIICLIDTAEANKVARSEATYKFLKTSITYRSTLFTQKDVKDIEAMLGEISKQETVGNFKKYCLIKNIKLDTETITRPHPYYMELILSSKETGKPVIAQSIEEPDKLNVVMYLSEEIENAKLPDAKVLKTYISEKKMDEAFTRNFKKLKTMAHITKHSENIKRVTQ